MAAVPHQPRSLSMLDAAEEYLAAGLSVIPVIGGGKEPNYHALLLPDGRSVKWQYFQQQAPTPIRLAYWLRQDPDANIGIVGGRISGNLTILDIDSLDLVAWLEQNAQAVLQQCWTVRTGSGKLHLYIRSPQPLKSTLVKDAHGTHLIDVRAEGEYATAPPSRHPSGGRYSTLWGGPTKIPQVGDPLKLAQTLVERFTNQRTSTTVAMGNTGTVPELDENGKRDLLRRLRNLKVPERVRKGVVFTPEPGSDDWKGCPSHSEIDFIVCKELRAASVTRAEIHAIYQSFSIGEQYRSDQPNRGYAYIERTLDAIDAELAGSKGLARQATGENFQVIHALRIMGDPPTYELQILDVVSNEKGKVRLGYDDLKSELKFRYAVLASMPRLLPVLRAVHSGKNWPVFVGLLARIADLEAVPDDATQVGHLRATILSLLSTWKIETLIPQTPGDFVLGWRDNTQKLVYVRGTRLLSELGMMLRQMPDPNTIWQIMRGLGATQKRVRIGSNSENLWVLPAQSVDAR